MRPQYLCEGEGAGACAVVGLVGTGRDDPTAPAHRPKIRRVGDQAAPLPGTLLHPAQLALNINSCHWHQAQKTQIKSRRKGKMLSSQNVKNAAELRPNKSTGLAFLQRVEWVNLTYLVTFCEDDICIFFCDLSVQGEPRSADFQRILHTVGCFWGRVTIFDSITQVTVQGQLAPSEKLIQKNKPTGLRQQVC